MGIWLERNGLPQVDWWRVTEGATVVELWLERLRAALPGPGTHRRSRHFRVLAPYGERHVAGILQLAENTFAAFSRAFPELVAPAPPGGVAIIYFPSRETYYDFVDHFGSDGEWIESGGMFLDDGYPCVAINQSSPLLQDHVLVHELGHAALRMRGLPLWVEEGLVQKLERSVHDVDAQPITGERIEEHRVHWTAPRWAGFLDGTGWGRAELDADLPYELAWMLLTNMQIDDPGALRAFLGHACASDGGQRACRAYFGGSLDDRFEQIFGPTGGREAAG